MAKTAQKGEVKTKEIRTWHEHVCPACMQSYKHFDLTCPLRLLAYRDCVTCDVPTAEEPVLVDPYPEEQGYLPGGGKIE